MEEGRGNRAIEHQRSLAPGSAPPATRPGVKIVANSSAQFSSARWAAVNFSTYERLASYVVENFDPTYEPESANWSVTATAFVHNTSNEAVYTGAILQSFAPPQFFATINPPPTFGGRFKYSF